MAMVKRLNETGLRRLVRGMLQEMVDPTVTRDQAYARADRFAADYRNALAAVETEAELEAMQAEWSEILRAEAESLLPMLGDGGGTVTVVPTHDDELDLHVRYSWNGEPRKFSGDLEDLIGWISWI